MRVVAGSARGRKLVAPRGRDVRPTTDRVRESVFSMLESLGGLEGARVLDLFAGTGAMGIEALSRGAEAATFVEREPAALAAVRANLASTALTGGEVVRGDALEFVGRAGAGGGGFDVVFCDPPYAFTAWEGLLDALGRLAIGLVVAESAQSLPTVSGWDVVRHRRYGTTVMTLLRPASTADSSER
jgi:16S rRNA (guanine966-N2)-methyltransferase